MSDLIRADGFVARGADLADAPAIMRVLTAAFPGWPPVQLDGPALDHLEWKMSSPGLPEQGLNTVVTRDGVVVAVRLRWFVRAHIGEREMTDDRGLDFAVHPEYQQQGLGNFLMEHDACPDRPHGDFGSGLTSKHAAIHHIYRDDENVVGRHLRVWNRPLSLRSSVALRLRSGGPARLIRGLIEGVTSPIARGGDRAVLPAGAEVVEIEEFDDRADALWAVAKQQFRFALTREAAHLNWRHVDPRSGSRTLLGVVEDDRLLAWAVLRPSPPAIRLADFLVHPDRADAGLALLDRCVQLARASRGSALVTWLPVDHPSESLLESTDFIAARGTLLCRFWPERDGTTPFEAIQPLADLAAPIHVTMGDFDFA